jgi:hypothetical protein
VPSARVVGVTGVPSARAAGVAGGGVVVLVVVSVPAAHAPDANSEAVAAANRCFCNLMSISLERLGSGEATDVRFGEA